MKSSDLKQPYRNTLVFKALKQTFKIEREFKKNLG